MARKVHTITSLPADAPGAPGSDSVAAKDPLLIRALDGVLGVQRPAVLAHLRSIRRRHPDASPAEMLRILEHRYLAVVTTTGAAVGATAVVPGVGTGITLALSGVETVGFLESTALYAQSVAEVHGIRVADPARARALVLSLMLGSESSQLMTQFAGQANGSGVPRQAFWGEMVTKTLPQAAMGPVADKVKKEFVRQFTKRGGASVVGKAMPFGVGAAIGAGGNHLLGRKIVKASRLAFGPPPGILPIELEPPAPVKKLSRRSKKADQDALPSRRKRKELTRGGHADPPPEAPR